MLQFGVSDFRKCHGYPHQNQDKGQITIPNRSRSKARLMKGDLVEGKMVRTPKAVIDRSKSPNADDEYTPAQRRVIDARPKKSLEEVGRGHNAGPFNTADEMIASLKRELRKASRKKYQIPYPMKVDDNIPRVVEQLKAAPPREEVRREPRPLARSTKIGASTSKSKTTPTSFSTSSPPEIRP
jgi:bifunctional DNA-binding transcriptional regulator/antitoxin component of YhaV-PrlF toxin-antitoxin module